MRTWVSFQAQFPQFTIPGEFRGYEIAIYLAQCLRASNLSVTEPETLEGYVYDFDCVLPAGAINILLYHVQNDVREWLLIMRPRDLKHQAITNAAEPNLIQQIHHLLQADNRFNNIRWYTEESWDVDPDHGWTSTP